MLFYQLTKDIILYWDFYKYLSFTYYLICYFHLNKILYSSYIVLKFLSTQFFQKLFIGEDFGVPVLTVHNVDPCIEENGENHRTSRYELMTRHDDRARLVVRRGQEFYLHLSLSRDYISSIDGISIVFTLDSIERPQYGHGTLVATAVLNPGEISEAAWQTTIDAKAQNFLRIKAS